MQQRPYGSRSSYGERLRGALQLDPRTYRDVEQDVDANGQAALTVALAALASAIGALGAPDWARLAVGTIIASVLEWVVFSFAAYFVGASLFSTPQTSVTPGQVLRTIGFAQSPKFLRVLGFIPILGGLLSLVAWIWFIVAAITALRESFEFDTARAIGTGSVALIVIIIVEVVLGIIFGVGLALFGVVASAF